MDGLRDAQARFQAAEADRRAATVAVELARLHATAAAKTYRNTVLAFRVTVVMALVSVATTVFSLLYH